MFKYKYKIETLTKTKSFEINVNACNPEDAKNFLRARYPMEEYTYELLNCENNNK